jgi:4-amino-4-deoxy-L-arabinose transferase-like glycosyltransferase
MTLKMKNSHFILILLAIAAILFFFRLGDMALTDPDESFYAQTAKEMLAAGEWATPRIFGQPQFEKPVLYYWLVISSYIVFGVGEFAARFPSAIFGIIGVIGVFLLGRRLYSPLCGFLSAVILATSVEYLVLARACVTDMVLTVFMLYMLFFFIEGWITGRKIYFLLSAAMAALATLTKGPIGFLLPGLILCLYFVFSRQTKDILKKVPVFLCVLVFLAVAVPWYVVVKVSHGGDFLQEFYGVHHITRFLHPEHRIGSSPWFYIPIVLGGIFPWTLFFLLGVWQNFKKGAAAGRIGSERLFLGIWFLAIFIFFSVSRTKLVTYIFPLFPAMAIITGRFWENIFTGGCKDERTARVLKASFWIFLAASVIMAAGAAGVTWHKLPNPMAIKGVLISSLVFLLFAGASVVFIVKGKAVLSFWAIALSVVFTSIPLSEYLFPVIEEYESSKALSLKAIELAGPNEELGAECDHRRGVAFYSGRTEIADIHPYGDLKTFYSQEGRVWGIIQTKHYAQLKGELKDAVLDPVATSGEYVLITNKK